MKTITYFKHFLSIQLICGLCLAFTACNKPEEEDNMQGRAGYILEEGRTWSKFSYSNETFFKKCGTFVSWIEGDTNMDGETWKKIYSTTELNDTSLVFYRLEDEKLWYKHDAEHTPCLMADFGVRKGDVIPNQGMSDARLNVVRVFDTVLPGSSGKLVRAIEVEEGRSMERDIWVEGIGSLQRGLSPTFNVVGGWRYHYILCSEGKDGSQYRNPLFNTCYVGSFDEIPEDVLTKSK